MRQISLLDCTLRDGGYVNGWMFGRNEINRIIRGLEASGVDMIELGFLRDTEYQEDSASFCTAEKAACFLKPKQAEVVYSAMIEAFNPYPLEKLSCRSTDGIDLIRICIWKRCMDEHLEYCQAAGRKGYQISIQPSRVEQYSFYEFAEMCRRANELHPYAVYIVDTWGTQSEGQICRYMEIADRHLDAGIRAGYHGHNNKLQAFSCAKAVLDMKMERELCLDASIMGMGRGAGNLCTEIMMSYLNEHDGKSYGIEHIIQAFDDCLNETYRKTPWGYSMYYYLASEYGCNPDFAAYFSVRKYGLARFQKFLETLSEQEKIVFSESFAEQRLKTL